MSGNSDLHKTDQDSWNARWVENNIPFDKGYSHKALVHLLSQAGTEGVPDIPREGSALVPGCGRGYDVHTLAQRGLNTTGLEISPKAVEAANQWIKSQSLQPTAQAQVELGDFFHLPRPEDGFDLFYDYTFLCALPPVLRKDWASSYAHLSHPGSILITLQFPLDPSREGGPPYALSKEIYDELLGNEWERVWGVDVGVEEARTKREEYKEGIERIVVWRRK